jgi:hypothetical protein
VFLAKRFFYIPPFSMIWRLTNSQKGAFVSGIHIWLSLEIGQSLVRCNIQFILAVKLSTQK